MPTRFSILFWLLLTILLVILSGASLLVSFLLPPSANQPGQYLLGAFGMGTFVSARILWKKILS